MIYALRDFFVKTEGYLSSVQKLRGFKENSNISENLIMREE